MTHSAHGAGERPGSKTRGRPASRAVSGEGALQRLGGKVVGRLVDEAVASAQIVQPC